MSNNQPGFIPPPPDNGDSPHHHINNDNNNNNNNPTGQYEYGCVDNLFNDGDDISDDDVHLHRNTMFTPSHVPSRMTPCVLTPTTSLKGSDDEDTSNEERNIFSRSLSGQPPPFHGSLSSTSKSSVRARPPPPPPHEFTTTHPPSNPHSGSSGLSNHNITSQSDNAIAAIIGAKAASHKPAGIFKHSAITQLQRGVAEGNFVTNLSTHQQQQSTSSKSVNNKNKADKVLSGSPSPALSTTSTHNPLQPSYSSSSTTSLSTQPSSILLIPPQPTTTLSKSYSNFSSHTTPHNSELDQIIDNASSGTHIPPNLSGADSNHNSTVPTTKIKSLFKKSSQLYHEETVSNASLAVSPSDKLLFEHGTDPATKQAALLFPSTLTPSSSLTESNNSTTTPTTTTPTTTQQPSKPNLIIVRHNQPMIKNNQVKVQSMFGEAETNTIATTPTAGGSKPSGKALRLLGDNQQQDYDPNFTNIHDEDTSNVQFHRNPVLFDNEQKRKADVIWQHSMIQGQRRGANVSIVEEDESSSMINRTSSILGRDVGRLTTSHHHQGGLGPNLTLAEDISELQKRSKECSICGTCIYWHGQWVKTRHFVRPAVASCIDCGYYHSDRTQHPTSGSSYDTRPFNNKHAPLILSGSTQLPNFSRSNIICLSCLGQLGSTEVPTTHHGHFIINYPVLPVPDVHYQPSSVLTSLTILPSRRHFYYHIASALRPLYVNHLLQRSFKPPPIIHPSSSHKLPIRTEYIIGFSMLAMLQAGFQSAGMYFPLLGRLVSPNSEFSACLHNVDCQRILYLQPLRHGQENFCQNQPQALEDEKQVSLLENQLQQTQSLQAGTRTGGINSSSNVANATGYSDSHLDKLLSTAHVQHHLCACMLYTGSYALRPSSIHNAPHKAGYNTDQRIRWLSYRDTMYCIQSLFQTLFTPIHRISQDLHSEKASGLHTKQPSGREHRRGVQTAPTFSAISNISSSSIPPPPPPSPSMHNLRALDEGSTVRSDDDSIFDIAGGPNFDKFWELQRDLHNSSLSHSRNFTQSFRLPPSLCLPGSSIVSVFGPNTIHSIMMDAMCATTGIVSANIHYSTQSTQLCSLLYHPNDNIKTQAEMNQIFKNLNTLGWYVAEDRFGASSTAHTHLYNQQHNGGAARDPSVSAAAPVARPSPSAAAMQGSYQLEQQRLLVEQRHFIPALPIAGKELMSATKVRFSLSNSFLSFLSSIQYLQSNVVATTPTVAAVLLTMLKSQYAKQLETKRFQTVPEDTISVTTREPAQSFSVDRSRGRTYSDARLNNNIDDYLEYDLAEHFVFDIDVINGIDLPNLRCIILLHDIPYYHYFGGIHVVSISSLLQHGFAGRQFIANDHLAFKFPLAEHISKLQAFATHVDEAKEKYRAQLELQYNIPPEHQFSAPRRSAQPPPMDQSTSKALSMIDHSMSSAYHQLYGVPSPQDITDLTLPHFYPSLASFDTPKPTASVVVDNDFPTGIASRVVSESISHTIPSAPAVDSPQDIIFSFTMTGGTTSSSFNPSGGNLAASSLIPSGTTLETKLPPPARFAILGQQSFAHSLFNNLSTNFANGEELISDQSPPPPIEVLHEPISHFNGKSTLYNTIVKHGRCCIYSHIPDKDSEQVVSRYLRTMTSLTAVGSTGTQQSVVSAWASTLSVLTTQKVQFFWLVCHLQPTSIAAVPSIWANLLTLYHTLYKSLFQRIMYLFSTSREASQLVAISGPYVTTTTTTNTPNTPNPQLHSPSTPTSRAISLSKSPALHSQFSSSTTPNTPQPPSTLFTTVSQHLPSSLGQYYIPPLPIVTHIVATKVIAYIRYRLGFRLKSISTGSAHVDETLYLFLQTLANGLGQSYQQTSSIHNQFLGQNGLIDYHNDHNNTNNTPGKHDGIDDHQLSINPHGSSQTREISMTSDLSESGDHAGDFSEMQKNQFIPFVVKGRVPILLQDAMTVEFFGIDGGWPLFSFDPIKTAPVSINPINTTLLYPSNLIFDFLTNVPIVDIPFYREGAIGELTTGEFPYSTTAQAISNRNQLQLISPTMAPTSTQPAPAPSPVAPSPIASLLKNAAGNLTQSSAVLTSLEHAPVSNYRFYTSPSVVTCLTTPLPTVSILSRVGCFEVYGSTETGMVTINRTLAPRGANTPPLPAPSFLTNQAKVLNTPQVNPLSGVLENTSANPLRMLLRSVYLHQPSGTLLFHNIDSTGAMVGSQKSIDGLAQYGIVPVHQALITTHQQPHTDQASSRARTSSTSSISTAFTSSTDTSSATHTPSRIQTLRGEIVIRAPGKALGYMTPTVQPKSSLEICTENGIPPEVLRYCAPHTPFLDNDWYCSLDIGEQTVHVEQKEGVVLGGNTLVDVPISYDILQESPIRILGRIQRIRKGPNGEFIDWSLLESFLNQKAVKVDQKLPALPNFSTPQVPSNSRQLSSSIMSTPTLPTIPAHGSCDLSLPDTPPLSTLMSQPPQLSSSTAGIFGAFQEPPVSGTGAHNNNSNNKIVVPHKISTLGLRSTHSLGQVAPEDKVGLIKGTRMIQQAIILLPGLDFDPPPLPQHLQQSHGGVTIPKPNSICLLVVEQTSLSLITPFVPPQKGSANATRGAVITSPQISLYYKQHLQSVIIDSLGLGMEYIPDIIIVTTHPCSIDNYCVSTTGKILRGAIATRFYDSLTTATHDWTEQALSAVTGHGSLVESVFPSLPGQQQQQQQQTSGRSMSVLSPLPTIPQVPVRTGRAGRGAQSFNRDESVERPSTLPPLPTLAPPTPPLTPIDELQLLLQLIISVVSLIGVDIGVVIPNIDYYHQLVTAAVHAQTQQKVITTHQHQEKQSLRDYIWTSLSQVDRALLQLIVHNNILRLPLSAIGVDSFSLQRLTTFVYQKFDYIIGSVLQQYSLIELYDVINTIRCTKLNIKTYRKLASITVDDLTQYETLRPNRPTRPSVAIRESSVSRLRERRDVSITRTASSLSSLVNPPIERASLSSLDEGSSSKPALSLVIPPIPSASSATPSAPETPRQSTSSFRIPPPPMPSMALPSAPVGEVAATGVIAPKVPQRGESLARVLRSSSITPGVRKPLTIDPSVEGRDDKRLASPRLAQPPLPLLHRRAAPPVPKQVFQPMALTSLITPPSINTILEILTREMSSFLLQSDIELQSVISHILNTPSSNTNSISSASLNLNGTGTGKSASEFLKAQPKLENHTGMHSIRTVTLVTGATGHVGMHLLKQLLFDAAQFQFDRITGDALGFDKRVIAAVRVTPEDMAAYTSHRKHQQSHQKSYIPLCGSFHALGEETECYYYKAAAAAYKLKNALIDAKLLLPHDCSHNGANTAHHFHPQEKPELTKNKKDKEKREHPQNYDTSDLCIKKMRHLYHDPNIMCPDSYLNKTQQTYPYICNCLFASVIVLPIDVAQSWWGLPLGNDRFIGLEEARSSKLQSERDSTIDDGSSACRSSMVPPLSPHNGSQSDLKTSSHSITPQSTTSPNHQSLMNAKYPKRLAQQLSDDVTTIFTTTASYFANAVSITHSKHNPPSLLALSLVLSRIYTAAATVSHTKSFTELYGANVQSLVTTAIVAKIGSQFRKLLHSRYTNRLHLVQGPESGARESSLDFHGLGASGVESFYNPNSTGTIVNSSSFDIRVYHISTTDTIDEQSPVGAPLGLDQVFGLKTGAQSAVTSHDRTALPSRDLGVVLADDPNKKEKQVVICHLTTAQRVGPANNATSTDNGNIPQNNGSGDRTSISMGRVNSHGFHSTNQDLVRPIYVQPEDFIHSGYRQSKLVGERLLVGCCRGWGVPLLVFNCGHVTLPWGHNNRSAYNVDPNLVNDFESDDETIPSEFEHADQDRGTTGLFTSPSNFGTIDEYNAKKNTSTQQITVKKDKEGEEKSGGFLKKFLQTHLSSQQRNTNSNDKKDSAIRTGVAGVIQHYQPNLELFPPVALTSHDHLYAPLVDYTDTNALVQQSQAFGPQVSSHYPQDFPHALLASVALQHATPPLTNLSQKHKIQGSSKVDYAKPDRFDVKMNLYPVDWLALAIVQTSGRHDDLPIFYQFYQGQSSQYLTQDSKNCLESNEIGFSSSTLVPITSGSPGQQHNVLPPAHNLKQASLRAITSDPDRFRDHLSGYLPQYDSISNLCLYPNTIATGGSVFEYMALRALRTAENKQVQAGTDDAQHYNDSLWYDFHSPLAPGVINQIRGTQSRIYRAQPSLSSKLVLSTLSSLTRNALQVLSPETANSSSSSHGGLGQQQSELNLRATQSHLRDSNLAFWSNNGMRIILSHHQPLSMDSIVRKCLRVSYPEKIPPALPAPDLLVSTDEELHRNPRHGSQHHHTTVQSIHKLILPFHNHTLSPNTISELLPTSVYVPSEIRSANDSYHDVRDSESSRDSTSFNLKIGFATGNDRTNLILAPLQRYQNRGIFSIPNLRRISSPSTYSNWLLTLIAPIYCYYYDRITHIQQQVQIPSPVLSAYLTHLASNTKISDDLVWCSLSSHLLLYHLGVTPVQANQNVVLQGFLTNIAQRFIQSTFSKNIKRQSKQTRRLSSNVGLQ